MKNKQLSTNDNHLIENGKKILSIEQDAITEIKNNLDKNFAQAIKLIIKAKGILIISGMGKSGLIAKKISATFSSLGTPSTYIHPGDALHGDLGLIKKEDLIIMISYSGETEELLNLQLFLEDQGNTSIIISGNKKSSLAKSCNLFINGSVKKEACNHNLAPTSSTTAALAIGDAMAVTVSKFKGFRKDDFIKYHPSGYLGRLYIKQVGDLMVKSKLPICYEDTAIIDAISIITKGCMGAAFVINSTNNLIGIITDGDLRRGFQNNLNLSEKIKLIMNNNPKTISKNEKIITASKKMIKEKVSILAVTQNNKLIGAIQLMNCK